MISKTSEHGNVLRRVSLIPCIVARDSRRFAVPASHRSPVPRADERITGFEELTPPTQFLQVHGIIVLPLKLVYNCRMVLKIALVVIFAATSLLAQDSSQNQTFGIWNGLWWTSMTITEKILYLTGVMDGITIGTSDLTTEQMAKLRKTWPTGFTGRDFINELEVLYKDRENIRLPIPMALQYCALKLKGETTKEELELRLALMRQVVQSKQ
jgi:hypothetical protein